MGLEDIEATVLRLWEREVSSDLSRLSRIPSSDMQCFLDILKMPSAPRLSEVVGAFATRATCIVAGIPFADRPLAEPLAAALGRLEELHSATRWADSKYMSLRMQKTSITLSSKYGAPIDWLPPAEVARIQSATTARAPALRKGIKTVLKRRGFEQTSSHPGEWFWRSGGERGFEIWFDFGGLDNQLRYEVMPCKERDTPLKRRPIGFEAMMGLVGFAPANGNWNRIEAEQVEEISELVGDLIGDVLFFLEHAESALRSGA